MTSPILQSLLEVGHQVKGKKTKQEKSIWKGIRVGHREMDRKAGILAEEIKNSCV